MWNQTHPDWLVNILPDSLGTGIFFTIEDGELTKKDFAKDIAYNECLEQAKNYRAFQWVPHTIMGYDDLLNST